MGKHSICVLVYYQFFFNNFCIEYTNKKVIFLPKLLTIVLLPLTIPRSRIWLECD